MEKNPAPACVKIVSMIRELSEFETERERIDQEYNNIIKKIKLSKEDIKKELEKCFQDDK
jgi:hypothetical protein